MRSTCEDRDGNLWIGTAGGLDRLRDGKVTSYTTKDGLLDNRIHRVYQDRDGSLWVGGQGGLHRYRDGTFTAFTAKDGLSNEVVVEIREDREGSLWIGTAGGGLNRLRDGKLTTLTTREGLSKDVVNSMGEDGEGNIWIGTFGGGLDRFRDGKVTSFTTKDGLSHDEIVPTHVARDGTVWVGTNGGALNRFRDGKWTSFRPEEDLSSGTIWAIREDREGSIWIGTHLGGLKRFRNGAFTSYTTKNGLSSNMVFSIAEAPDGSLWIGTADGLNRLLNGKLTTYTTKNGLSENEIHAIHPDRDGRLWIGTAGGGLNRFEDGKFTSYTRKSGLFDDIVTWIAEDDQGNLWMTCMKGVFRASKKDLNAFAEGKLQSISSVSYDTFDGMKSVACTNDGGKTRDGRLWFPTMRGLAVIDPARIPVNTLPPPVVLEEFLVDRKLVARGPAGSSLVLPPGKERFEFHYTANSLLVPKRVKFRYRLEGYDEDWVDAGTERSARYTNLPPRSYTFRVIASNDDGVWNEKGAAFGFSLRPRFHQTWWFHGLEALAAMGLLAGAFALQRRRLQVRADHRRMSEELEEARRVQLALLPKAPLTVGPWTVAGRMQTATEVGGDYYGYLESAGRLCVVIGDATGHGMAAGLVAGMLKSATAALSQSADRSEGPERWLHGLNTALRTSIAHRGLGVCVAIALLDVESGEVELAVAGIPHPFRIAAGSVERLQLSGTPLGYLKRIVTATARRTLAPGDRLVLMTDGLIEQVGPAGEEWGYSGVEAALSALGDVDPAQMAEGLLAACDRFAAGLPRSDDRTVVVLEHRRGPPSREELPAVDDRLVKPETREEVLRGVRIDASPAGEPHDTDHFRVGNVVAAHLARATSAPWTC